MARLVETTYASGPNDKLITVDAYKITDLDVRNNNPNIDDVFVATQLNDVKAGNKKESLLGTDMIKNVCDKNFGLEVNPKSLLDGVIASNSELFSAMKSLPSELQAGLTKVNKTIEQANGVVNGVVSQVNNVANQVNGAVSQVKSVVNGVVTQVNSVINQAKSTVDQVKGVYNNVVATVDGVTNIIKHADLTTLTGLGTMINTLSGAKLPMSFVDKTGLSNLATNLIRESNKLGIPNAFSAFSKTIKDVKILNGIVKNILPDIIEKSSTGLLKQIADSQVAMDVKKILPSFKNDFTTAYTKPVFATVADITKEFNTINDSFTKMDPGWQTCRKNGADTTINATTWSNASKDFKEIAKTATTTVYTPIDVTDPITLNNAVNTSPEKYMCLASYYGDVDSSKELAQNNPTLLFSTPLQYT